MNQKKIKQRRSSSKKSSPAQGEYEVSIPSRQDIAAFLDAAPAPLALRDIAAALEVVEKPGIVGLRRRLQAMTRDGELLHTRGNRYGIAKRMELIAGRVLGHADGFAFVRPDDGDADVFLSHREAHGVLHGDRVLVRIGGYDKRDRPYGNVVEILERANEQVVGRYYRERGIGFVTPDDRRINQDILIAKAGKKVKNGQFVVAKITEQPDHRRQAMGEIVEILGDHMAPGMEIDVAIRTYDLPVEWPAEVAAELARIPAQVSADAIEGRRDLRDLPFVTIDGEDARDFDDAVFCRKSADGFTLYVAIADVAHYVRPGSALDAEARARGTSVYFPNQVIPMLPEVLSNGLCSLNPQVDRLVMVCEMRFDGRGEIHRSRFYNGVIHSQARLTYTEVAAWLAEDKTPAKGTLKFHVRSLCALYEQLRERRAERGALDFESREPFFVFDNERKIERIDARQRNDAHRLIEEAMIAANVAAATDLIKHERAALFRNHERPDPERLAGLREFLGGVGLSLGGGDAPTALDFAETLASAAGRIDRHLIETILLRGQKLAAYEATNRGHFGLALEAYAHFTSPIRRYPDLIVHRALKDRIARRKQSPDAVADMVALGTHCSMTERRAEEATRDVVAWLKCEYMEDKVGESFKGVISGVTSFGVFVELADIFVEGLIHVTSLPQDYYEFDPIRHTLRGRASGRTFTIGGEVDVTVARVSLDDRKIDFSLAQAPKRRRRRKS
jgi:ribonuclease R